MFVDLVGSTALASRLDPEEMAKLLRAYQGRWRARSRGSRGTLLEQISFCLNRGGFPTLCQSADLLGIDSFLGASDAEALFHRPA